MSCYGSQKRKSGNQRGNVGKAVFNTALTNTSSSKNICLQSASLWIATTKKEGVWRAFDQSGIFCWGSTTINNRSAIYYALRVRLGYRYDKPRSRCVIMSDKRRRRLQKHWLQRDLAIKTHVCGDVVIVYMDESSYVHQNHFPKRCWFHPDRPKVTRPRGKGQSETHHCVRHNEGWASSLLSTWGRQPTSSGRVWLRCISHQRNGFPSKKSSWRLSWSDGLRYVHHVVQAAPGSSIWDQISR